MGHMSVTFKDIRAAQQALQGNIVRTPLLYSAKLSEITGAQVYVKFENFQVTNSFKDRGAYVKLAGLSSPERAHGVIAMSAGNHAQAVAYHARRLGIPATIVMPEGTPLVKAENTRSYGAQVILDGETLYESALRAREIAEAEGLVFVHP